MNAALTVLVALLGLSAAVTPVAVWRRSWPALTAAAIVSLACCVVGGFTLAMLAGFLPCMQLGLAVAIRWRLRWLWALALLPAVAWAAVALGQPTGFAFIAIVPIWTIAAAIALVLGDPQWRGRPVADA